MLMSIYGIKISLAIGMIKKLQFVIIFQRNSFVNTYCSDIAPYQLLIVYLYRVLAMLPKQYREFVPFPVQIDKHCCSYMLMIS